MKDISTSHYNVNNHLAKAKEEAAGPGNSKMENNILDGLLLKTSTLVLNLTHAQTNDLTDN
jgi:hypothetical protein